MAEISRRQFARLALMLLSSKTEEKLLELQHNVKNLGMLVVQRNPVGYTMISIWMTACRGVHVPGLTIILPVLGGKPGQQQAHAWMFQGTRFAKTRGYLSRY